jgi:hypothetical protein
MTEPIVECSDIETVLAPPRRHGTFDQKVISITHHFRDVHWESTSNPPVSEWLGNADLSNSNEPFMQSAKIAAFVAFLDRIPVLASGHSWSLLEHQAGGVACLHRSFVGRRLLLKPRVEFELLKIADYWYDQDRIRGFEQSLDVLMEYRAQLQQIGLDCNLPGTYRYLTEAFYPADLSQDLIDHICLRPFPLESTLGTPRPYGNVEYMAVLLFIAPNSD